MPCGAVAGVFARTDSERGIWKAPAGLDATLRGVRDLTVKLTDAENGTLNQLGINCLRTFPASGNIVWGSRTLRGADQMADEWKYIPVRRTAMFIEESLFRGTQWVVFEPNDEPLWAQIRLSIGAFMNGLFRQGAFQGKTPRDAYFVKCDGETTTQSRHRPRDRQHRRRLRAAEAGRVRRDQAPADRRITRRMNRARAPRPNHLHEEVLVPPSLTYPGVYIEEVPSGVRTIVGVATSITAFIGAAPIGPVDTATEVDSWAEFERTFGGLWTESRLGFAVRDFFLNGGNRALIVRVYGGDATADDRDHHQGEPHAGGGEPGSWANNLRVRVTHPVASTIQIAADNLGVPVDDLFDLTIHDASTPTGATEIYHNLTYQAEQLAADRPRARRHSPRSSGGRATRRRAVIPIRTTTCPTRTQDKIWTDDKYSTGVGTAIGDEPALTSAAFVGDQFAVEKRGLFALEQADLFNLLCIPPFGSDDDMAIGRRRRRHVLRSAARDVAARPAVDVDRRRQGARRLRNASAPAARTRRSTSRS